MNEISIMADEALPLVERIIHISEIVLTWLLWLIISMLLSDINKRLIIYFY